MLSYFAILDQCHSTNSNVSITENYQTINALIVCYKRIVAVLAPAGTAFLMGNPIININ
jgi:hypothetical protein